MFTDKIPKIFSYFSVIRNGRDLIKYDKNNKLNIFNGIKVLTMGLVLFGHKFMYFIINPIMYTRLLEQVWFKYNNQHTCLQARIKSDIDLEVYILLGPRTAPAVIFDEEEKNTYLSVRQIFVYLYIYTYVYGCCKGGPHSPQKLFDEQNKKSHSLFFYVVTPSADHLWATKFLGRLKDDPLAP